MIKRSIVSCVAVFTALVLGGCAVPKPDFNQTYLPNTVPGSPERRVALTGAMVDKAAKNGTDIKALPLSLSWIEDDNLLFSILSKDRQKTLHGFLVSYSTGQVKALNDAEKDALLSRIEKRIIADKKGSSLGEVIGFTIQVTIALAGGGGSGSGPSSGNQFLGKIVNAGNVLDIDASVKKKSKWSIFPTSYDCSYKIKNSQTGRMLTGKMTIEKHGSKQESLMTWLKSWRISPDGRSYLIGQTAMVIDYESTEDDGHSVIANYPYAALDVSPKWDKIALLMFKEDEKTKQKDYWIEVYPFDYGKK